MHPALLVLASLLSFSAFAQQGEAAFRGEVIHITDGDNLTIVAAKEWIRVRLAGVDAPERNQPYGTRASQSLSDLCFWQEVIVTPAGKDEYGRMLARVRCGDVDAGEEQVRRGMAWVYDRYIKDPSLVPLQEEAQAAKRGLWADPYAKPPWEWREAWD